MVSLWLNVLFLLADSSEKISKDAGFFCTTHTDQNADDCDGYHLTCGRVGEKPTVILDSVIQGTTPSRCNPAQHAANVIMYDTRVFM